MSVIQEQKKLNTKVLKTTFPIFTVTFRWLNGSSKYKLMSFVFFIFMSLDLGAAVRDSNLSSKGKGASVPTPGVRSVSKAVGEVGDTIVTSREVQINDAINQVVEGRRLGATDFSILNPGDPIFVESVTSVLVEWAIAIDAKTFSENAQVKTEIPKWSQKVQEAWSARPEWKRLAPSQEEVRAILERKLIAREVIKLKTDSSLVPVTDNEAEDYFKKNRLKFGTMPFAAFRENIKSYLVKTQTERRLKDWVETLSRKYKFRNYLAG